MLKCAQWERWRTRQLDERIGSMLFELTTISKNRKKRFGWNWSY